MNYGMVSPGCKMSCGSTPQNVMTFKNKSFTIFVKHTSKYHTIIFHTTCGVYS